MVGKGVPGLCRVSVPTAQQPPAPSWMDSMRRVPLGDVEWLGSPPGLPPPELPPEPPPAPGVDKAGPLGRTSPSPNPSNAEAARRLVGCRMPPFPPELCPICSICPYIPTPPPPWETVTLALYSLTCH